MKVNLEKLAEFLVKAKQHTWAARADRIEPERPGFKEFIFKDGLWSYRDSYVSKVMSHGTEVVRYDEWPVWLMSSCGGMMPKFRKDRKLTKETFDFLKEALMQVDTDFPFRGPAIHLGRFEYQNAISGTIRLFTGTEVICDRHGDKTKLYQAYYIGNLIVPCR
jgi:hypothetical protein